MGETFDNFFDYDERFQPFQGIRSPLQLCQKME
jgi:hypothetical protein